MKIRTAIMAGIAAAVAAPLTIASPAAADTENCVSRGEWDNMTYGLDPVQVYNRFDVFGVYWDDTDATYRRAYNRLCWNDERRAFVVFSYDTGGSVDWYTREK